MPVGMDGSGLSAACRCTVFALALGLRPAPAAAGDGPLVWYRSGEGCPDASAFLRKLEKRSATARVAGMGDAIDFVVTLSRDATHGWGRVERQTSRGTVAIRELEAQSCDAVADGLALSLALAIEPEPQTASVHASEPGREPPLAATPAAPPPTRDVIAEVPSGPTADAAHAGLSWLLGFQGGLFTLVGSALASAGPFVEVAPWASEGARGPTFRLGAWGTLPTEIAPDIDVWLVAGRLEACPWSLDAPRLELRPCIGVELGALAAERVVADTPRDTALWASLVGHARVAWAVTDAVMLEAQTGFGAALGRHDFITSSPARDTARTEAIGLSAGVGMSVRLP